MLAVVAGVFVFQRVPNPLIKLVFAGDVALAALVVKGESEALFLDGKKGELFGLFHGFADWVMWIKRAGG